MSRLSAAQMIRLAKLVIVGTRNFKSSDGRFRSKVCHFSRPGLELGATASAALGRISVKMAELLMKSASEALNLE